MPQMLQTCTRCKSRRVKCDSLLPACANCAKADVECTFKDDALQAEVPRSYIKSLNDRIQDLSSQLALSRSAPGKEASDNNRQIFDSVSEGAPFHVLIPGAGKDLYLDQSSLSRITQMTFEVLFTSGSLENIPDEANNELPPELVFGDRSILTPSIVRFLLSRYEQRICPSYNIIPIHVLRHDGMSIKKLPDCPKFYLLIACAIAAAHESFRRPEWKACAQICRNWANELVAPLILPADGESLATILLLLIYELADPSRGAMWELLDLAIRTCLQLGWHRTSETLDVSSPTSFLSAETSNGASHSAKLRLMSTLRDIDGSLRIMFNRSTMLSGFRWPESNGSEAMLLCYEQLCQTIYSKHGAIASQSCPFVGDIFSLMRTLEGFPEASPIVKKAWLLYLPVCIRHRPCVFCFQEPDDSLGKGLRYLRGRLVKSASDLLHSTYEDTVVKENFVPPLLASYRALVAGCCIAASISKKWTDYQAQVKELLICTEILSLFASHWKGGRSYLCAWQIITSTLHTNAQSTHRMAIS